MLETVPFCDDLSIYFSEIRSDQKLIKKHIGNTPIFSNITRMVQNVHY